MLSFYTSIGVSSRGAALVRFDLFSMRKMLLLCPWRVHNRGADAIGRYDVLFNREADVIGRYYILVETVLLILVEDFTSILLFVGFFPSRSYCLALDWESDVGMEIEIIGNGIAVLPWQLPGIFRWNWDLPFHLAFVIVVRDLSYLAPNRGLFGVCGGLILVSGYLWFHIWGFLMCGEASLFLNDVARLWVFLTSRGQSDQRYN